MHWQKFMAVLMAVGLLFNFTGCKDEPELSPELTIEPTIVEAPAEGGDLSVSYTIKNPIEGSDIHATCEETWIADIHPSDSEIHFTVLPNDKEETRSAVVTVNYAGIEPAPTFTIQQTSGSSDQPDLTKEMFTLEASDVTQMDANIIIVAEDPEITYFGFHKLLDNFDESLTEDEIYENDMEWLQGWADSYGVSLKKLMSKNLIKGDHIIPIKQLTADTEYTYWVYGIDSKTLKRTTKITRIVFKTLEPEYSNAQISFTKEVNGDQLIVTYDPGDYTGYYFTSWYPICNPEYNPEDEKQDVEQLYLNQLSFLKDYKMLSDEEILKEIGSSGITKDTIDVEQDKCYLLTAMTIEEKNFSRTSEVYLDSYYHGTFVKFEMDIQPRIITGKAIEVNVTPNKPEQDYTLVIYKSSELEGLDDYQILRKICMIPEEEHKIYVGEQSIKFTDLEKSTEYTICGAAFDQSYNWVASGLRKTTVTTTDGNSANEPFFVDITASGMTETSADVTFVPNKADNEYTCMIYPKTTFQEMTEEEILADMVEAKNLDIHTGKYTGSYSNLNPGTSYIVCAAGYDSKTQAINSDLSKGNFKTVNAGFNVDIAVSDITSNTAKVTYTPNDLEADYSIMLLTADEIAGKSEQEIIDIMMITDNINTHHDVYVKTYDELKSATGYAVCAVKFNWDTFAPESGLFMKEFKTAEGGASEEFNLDIAVSDITSTTAKATYTPNDIAADYTTLLLTADEIAGKSEQEIIDILMITDNINTHHDVYITTYDELTPDTEYAICSTKFNWDTFSAESGLFMKEFKTAAAGSEFNIDIAVTDITATSATLNYTASDETREYTIIYYAYEDVQNATDDEILADMFTMDKLWPKKGTATWNLEDLLPETTYVACAAGMDSNTFTCNSGLFKTEFTTEAEAASDELTIDIAISDVTENSAKATFTPSDITKDFTTMIYTQAQFEAMTMEELVADMVDINYVNTHHDVYIKTFDELTPNTSYVVCAVGFSWDTYGANSEVFTMSLITAGGAAEKPANFIDIDYGAYYDAMAVAAAEPAYADMAAEGQVLMGFNVTSGTESEIVKWYITDAESINGWTDDDIAGFFRFSGYTDKNFVKAFDYGTSVCIMGIAYDKNGKPSEIFKGHEVVPTKDGVGDPAEFIANFPR